MWDELIFPILKYIGIALVPIAAIWSLLRKTTTEDEQGARRLTPSGYIAIALTLGIALTTAGAFGVERIIKAQERKNKAVETERQRLEAERLKEDAEQRHLLSQLLTLKTKAEVRARAAKQETLTLALAAEERARQFALSQAVNRNAVASLAKAERTLRDLGRVLQPAGAPKVRVIWRLSAPVRLSANLRARIDSVIRDENWNDPQKAEALRAQGISRWLGQPHGRVRSVSGKERSSIYPMRSEDPELVKLISGARVTAIFLLPDRAKTLLRTLGDESPMYPDFPTMWELYSGADYAFSVNPGYSISYDLVENGITLDGSGPTDSEEIMQSGALPSVQDFEKATLILFPHFSWSTHDATNVRTLQEQMKISVTMSLAGRPYSFSSSQLRRVQLPHNLGPIWVIDKLGDGRSNVRPQ